MPAMSNRKVKTRFAPSPTGLVHLGNIRTALFNVLLARKHAGKFLLRIEDTDQERSRPEFQVALQEDMRWLGLDWQEGPDAGGEHAPYNQSARGDIYQQYYDRLIERDLAYPCFCSERELKLVRKSQLAAGQPPRYAGTCARLSPQERQRKLEQGGQPSLRFRVPRGKVIEFEDAVRGKQVFNTDDIGDFIIRRSDGTPAFFFTNAIDDALMGVTHVLRGEDHLTNTPRQLLMLRALDLPEPQYGHISLIVSDEHNPLSKREGSQSVRVMREEGYLPEAINNHLARLGHAYEDSGKFMRLDELAAGFELSRLGKAPARHDAKQLLHWQHEAILHAGISTLIDWLGEELDAVPAAEREAFVNLIRGNITFPEDVRHWLDVLYTERLDYPEDAHDWFRQAGPAYFDAALNALEASPDAYQSFIEQLKSETGNKGKNLFMPLRMALSGRASGPELAPLYELMSAARKNERLSHARKLAE